MHFTKSDLIFATLIILGIAAYVWVSVNEAETKNASDGVVTETPAAEENRDATASTTLNDTGNPTSAIANTARGGQGDSPSQDQTVNSSTSRSAEDVLPLERILVREALDQPERYDGKDICLQGFYQSSFEFSAMGASFREVDGRKVLNEPYVWASIDESSYSLECTLLQNGQRNCLGEITVCGTFQYALPGEPGFGHVGAYRYQIIPPQAQPPSNQL